MILPDVNVLIYAFRKDAALHVVARSWLDSVIAGEGSFGISPAVLCAVTRISTDWRIYNEPSAVEEALAFCDDILSQPHWRIVEPGALHWSIFKRLCSDAGTNGRDITDAWYAALAIEWSCEWISFDRGFRRFPGLTWRSPNP